MTRLTETVDELTELLTALPSPTDPDGKLTRAQTAAQQQLAEFQAAQANDQVGNDE